MTGDDLRPGRRLDERGVALPLALFGLVTVSLLVTSALLTSSTELALSQAHQDGTRGLYSADAALEQFVAQRAAMVEDLDQRLAGGGFGVTLADGQGYVVNVAELFRTAALPLPSGALERRETYSLVANPQNGRGRSIGALIEATRVASMVPINIDSGLTLGTNTTITGNATISDGSSAGAPCDSASAPAAIRHSSNTTVTRQGAANDIYGDIIQDTRNSTDLMLHVLGGASLEELAALAHIRFGPAYGTPAFNDGSGPVSTSTQHLYRWGCPAQLVTGCTPEQAAYFPTVAIDANGGTVDITGTHGQGVLIIRNGDVHIRGSFAYAGIILVEGTLRVSGTPRMEGGVVAMGEETIIEPGDDSTTTGNSLIRFNQCMIVEARRGLTSQTFDSSPQSMDTPTFAWFEVVR